MAEIVNQLVTIFHKNTIVREYLTNRISLYTESPLLKALCKFWTNVRPRLGRHLKSRGSTCILQSDKTILIIIYYRHIETNNDEVLCTAHYDINVSQQFKSA